MKTKSWLMVLGLGIFLAMLISVGWILDRD